MLEFDGQALDPAIVSAQPMKPVQAVDLQQMGGALREWHLLTGYTEYGCTDLLVLLILANRL